MSPVPNVWERQYIHFAVFIASPIHLLRASCVSFICFSPTSCKTSRLFLHIASHRLA